MEIMINEHSHSTLRSHVHGEQISDESHTHVEPESGVINILLWCQYERFDFPDIPREILQGYFSGIY